MTQEENERGVPRFSASTPRASSAGVAVPDHQRHWHVLRRDPDDGGSGGGLRVPGAFLGTEHQAAGRAAGPPGADAAGTASRSTLLCPEGRVVHSHCREDASPAMGQVRPGSLRGL